MGKGKTYISSNNQQQGIGKAVLPELPHPLMKHFSVQHSLRHSIHGNVVAKQWRRANFKCKSTSQSTPIPWLELIENKRCSPKNPFIQRLSFISDSVLLQDINGDTSSVNMSLIRHGLLSLHIGYLQRKEIKLDSDEVDPNCHNPSEPKHLIRVANGVGFQGKIFVITMQGTLGVVEMVDSNIKITNFSRKRIVPSLFCKSYREYMIESDGRVLVVFLVSYRCVNVTDDVEIYQLKCKDLAWNRVENLKERSLFVDRNWACSVLASEVGCYPNNVFFNDGSDWWKYDMSTKMISPSQYVLVENM